MLLYFASVSAEEQMKNTDPAKIAEAMKPWEDWFAKNVSSVVDKGMPMGNSHNVTKEGATPASAPYVGGYSIVQVESIEKVEAMLADHPHFMMPVPGATILVSEVMSMPGM